jgi:hypothetical protein
MAQEGRLPMQTQATSAPFEDDGLYEESVLRHVLNWQPTILRISDLTREVRPVPDDRAPDDSVKRAVRELTKVGLLHRQGECVLPTPAAVYVRGWDL